MKKIFKYIFLFIVIISATSIATYARAQEAQLTVNAPKQVYEGDNFQISFSFNARGGSNLKVPPFKGFDVSGPFQSQSSNTSYINGKVSSSFTASYTYQLKALKAGTYNIGAASITADGNQYSSSPFTIQVIASANRPANQTQQNQAQQSQNRIQQPQAATSADISDNDLYIRVTANKSNPYKGEEVILTYKLYAAVALVNASLEKMPSFKGFWSEELGEVDERKQEIINGKRYIVSTFRKVAVFPQEAGTLSLEPLELRAIAQVVTPRKRTGSIWDIFDDPFFTPVQNVEKKIKSNTLTLRVKELPEDNMPESFGGTVGDFNVALDYDAAKQPISGEALTFKFTVTGHGNIEMITPPEIIFPPDFDIYEPQINSDKNATAAGVSGNMTFEYTVIPRSAGRFVIPSFDYIIFNPSKQKYETTTIPEISLDVAQGKETVSTYTNRQIKGDIEYIKTNTPKFKIAGYSFFLSLDFFILVTVVILLFAAAVITFKNRVKKQLDIVGIRNRKALREAKKCLKKASKFMTADKRDEFYTEISIALWGFISNKLNIPTAELSRDTVRDILELRELNPEYITQFIQTLDDCEFARFAPKGNATKDMQEIYNKAIDVIVSFPL
ncbi:MAG: BatD family protein [Bacteroidales bacterium]|jgi:hypothetical protein|nr:BatD family protein [Bacteroidales bacterium]